MQSYSVNKTFYEELNMNGLQKNINLLRILKKTLL